MASASDIQRELLRLVRTTAAEPVAQADAGALLRIDAQRSGIADPAVSPQQDGGPSPVDELVKELDSLKRQMSASEESARRQSEELAKYARAITESGGGQANRNVGAVAEDVVSAFRGAGGLGVLGSPLVGLISRLFRRRDSEAPPALPVYSEPAPVREDLALPGYGGASGLVPVSYRGDGLPRPAAAVSQPGASGTAPAGNVTIQVQTMDSRSFLDNSDQIARAVREAMLNSHSLNDVIGEM